MSNAVLIFNIPPASAFNHALYIYKPPIAFKFDFAATAKRLYNKMFGTPCLCVCTSSFSVYLESKNYSSNLLRFSQRRLLRLITHLLSRRLVQMTTVLDVPAPPPNYNIQTKLDPWPQRDHVMLEIILHRYSQSWHGWRATSCFHQPRRSSVIFWYFRAFSGCAREWLKMKAKVVLSLRSCKCFHGRRSVGGISSSNSVHWEIQGC